MDNSKAYYAFERPGWTKFQTFPENPIPGALLRPGSNFVCRTYRGGGAEQEGGGRGGADVDHGATGAVAAGRALQADEGQLAGVAHQQAEAHPKSYQERAAIPGNPPESTD